MKRNISLLTYVGPNEDTRSGFPNIYYRSQGPGTAPSQDLTFDVTSAVKFLLSSRWLVDHCSLSPVFPTHISLCVLCWNHLFIHTSLWFLTESPSLPISPLSFRVNSTGAVLEGMEEPHIVSPSKGHRATWMGNWWSVRGDWQARVLYSRSKSKVKTPCVREKGRPVF